MSDVMPMAEAEELIKEILKRDVDLRNNPTAIELLFEMIKVVNNKVDILNKEQRYVG